ncbi:MAG: nickel ABC transporter substrate-binding protein [Deltaproteobacteria bacterium]|jgi:nickel transport system substrate-binding protein|nr:nickel ABC transporter substrate-binding protein [Deltaproteobacteria bacterium]MDR2612156.1 nickel ABC transporter substrate-binding protein [Deltaproteobacteria bacterium]
MMQSIGQKCLLTLLMIGLLLFFAPCESRAQDYDPADTLVYSHSVNAGPLNPHMYAPNAIFAQNMVYDALVVMSPDGKIIPSLAESWEVSPDGLVYTFHLRKDVRFSDGTPLDAKAVAQNFKAITDNKDRHMWLGLTGYIKSFEAAGPLEFKLVISAPYYPTLNDLSLPRPFRMLSPAAFPDEGITAGGIKAPIGSGPWKFVETVMGEYDLFERNDLYWGAKPDYSKVLVKTIVDPISRGIAFETGEIDLIYGLGQVNYDIFDRFSHVQGITAKTSEPKGTSAIGLHAGRFPTDDLAVRQAIEYLTDREEVARGVSLGSLRPAGYYISPNMPYSDAGLPPYVHDPARAVSILEDAGWALPEGKSVREKDGRQLSIDYYFVASKADEKATAEIIQSQARKYGISINIIGEEEDAWKNRLITGEYGIISATTYGPPYEPHAFLPLMRFPDFSFHQSLVALPEKAEFDQALTDALASTDEVKRREYYKKALTILHDECVFVPLYYNALMAVYRTGKFAAPLEFGNNQYIVPFETFKLKK